MNKIKNALRWCAAVVAVVFLMGFLGFVCLSDGCDEARRIRDNLGVL